MLVLDYYSQTNSCECSIEIENFQVILFYCCLWLWLKFNKGVTVK